MWHPTRQHRLLITAGVLSGLALFPAETFAASGRVLKVGFGEAFSVPSAAAASAETGDIVEITSGTYDDCAVWPAQAGSITIRAAGNEPVVVTGQVCDHKALFVIKADNVLVSGITFTGATSPDHNGSAIRAEGRNLTVERSRFVDNEEGILAASQADSTITIRGSYFKGNGNCLLPAGCAHGIYANAIDRLVVEGCTFLEQHIGHHIKSRARRTELVANRIEDGPAGTASYLVDIPDGGSLIMRENILEKGPRSDNPTVAVTLGEESNSNPTAQIIVENNRFSNDTSGPTVFVRNLTRTPASVRGNVITGNVRLTEEQHLGDR
jgi:hypothetical protein